MLNVQFSDATQEIVLAYFGCPQDENAFPNQGTVAVSDARWKTFYASLPAMMQDALTASAAG